MPTREQQDKMVAELLEEMRHGASTSRASRLTYHVLATLDQRYHSNNAEFGLGVLSILRLARYQRCEHAVVGRSVIRLLDGALEDALNSARLDIEAAGDTIP